MRKLDASIRLLQHYDIGTDTMRGRLDVLFERKGKCQQFAIDTSMTTKSLFEPIGSVPSVSSDVNLANLINSFEQLAAKLRSASGYRYKRHGKKKKTKA